MSKKQHPLRANALAAIRLGVLDFASKEPDRVIAAARHIHAGLLLLYKEKLRSLSPPDSDESLVKDRIIPVRDAAGNVVWKGRGKRTASRAQVQERLESLGIGIDWKRFEKVANLRHELEHYHSPHALGTISEVVANAFVLVRDFLTLHLQLDPLATLGEEVWHVMLQAAEVFEKERADCLAALDAFAWDTQSSKDLTEEMRCPECESSLIVPSGEQAPRGWPSFRCRACGSAASTAQMIETALDGVHGFANYRSVKHGDEPETDTCPECSAEAFIYDAHECAVCGYTPEYDSCYRCGSGLRLEEQALDGLCPYCHHVTHKDD